MDQQVLYSHAKINVGLRIRGRREDGYHELETIFYPVKLRDVITISLERNGSGCNSVILKSNKSYIPLNKDNLCYLAFERFFKAFAIRDTYTCVMEIEKHIPVSGGMGGGSSNAATVIKFLVRQFKIDVPSNRSRLIDLSLSIGSDVPFFLIMRPCYATGRGEEMRELPSFVIDHNILIVNPNLRVSTKWAFEKMNLKGKPMKPELLSKIRKFEPSSFEILKNDFEPVIFDRMSALKEVKEKLLEAGAVYASLSGSGATLFGVFKKNERNGLRNALRHFQSLGYFTFVSSPG
ncbi:MAG: 4-(cytidine 5'-diphospho)-2-C-methyl-D-erythritol kinase [Ignavibacteria bacterium]|nr:4-(cytidine 5'-diphospho)-2-C-methyl-D-erythritol kinase [Ignavibacteria bacterium]